MRLAYPVFLWLLVLMPGVAWLEKRTASWRRSAWQRFAAREMQAGLQTLVPRHPHSLRLGLWMLAYAAAVLALARPQGNPLAPAQAAPALAGFIVLDTSSSMRCRDLGISRLEAAKTTAQNIIESLPGANLGLITTAAAPRMVCPATIDSDALGLCLRASAAAISSPPGSNPIAGAYLALEKLSRLENPAKTILLFSDGEMHGNPGTWEDLGRQAQKSGVQIYACGTGTAIGGSIPLGNDFWGKEKVRVHRGRLVITRLSSLGMRQAARFSRGGYWEWQPSGATGKNMATALQRWQQQAGRQEQAWVYPEYYAWLVILSLACLLADLGIAAAGARNQRPGGC